jgi:hypothetical protein
LFVDDAGKGVGAVGLNLSDWGQTLWSRRLAKWKLKLRNRQTEAYKIENLARQAQVTRGECYPCRVSIFEPLTLQVRYDTVEFTGNCRE